MSVSPALPVSGWATRSGDRLGARLPAGPSRSAPPLPAARSPAEPAHSHSPRWSRGLRPAERAQAAQPWEGAAPDPSPGPGPWSPAFGAGRRSPRCKVRGTAAEDAGVPEPTGAGLGGPLPGPGWGFQRTLGGSQESRGITWVLEGRVSRRLCPPPGRLLQNPQRPRSSTFFPQPPTNPRGAGRSR